MTPLKIKPHHFIDIVVRIGKGERVFFPHPYGHAFHLAARRVLEDPGTLLELEFGLDDICLPCIHNQKSTCDDVIDLSYRPDAPPLKREWNLLLDKRWCCSLQLEAGMQLTGIEFCGRLSGVGEEELQTIYRGIPVAMAAERGRRLKTGVEFLLSFR